MPTSPILSALLGSRKVPERPVSHVLNQFAERRESDEVLHVQVTLRRPSPVLSSAHLFDLQASLLQSSEKLVDFFLEALRLVEVLRPVEAHQSKLLGSLDGEPVLHFYRQESCALTLLRHLRGKIAAEGKSLEREFAAKSAPLLFSDTLAERLFCHPERASDFTQRVSLTESNESGGPVDLILGHEIRYSRGPRKSILRLDVQTLTLNPLTDNEIKLLQFYMRVVSCVS